MLLVGKRDKEVVKALFSIVKESKQVAGRINDKMVALNNEDVRRIGAKAGGDIHASDDSRGEKGRWGEWAGQGRAGQERVSLERMHACLW